jgi:hypothetical protein
MVIGEEKNLGADIAAIRAIPDAERIGLYASGHLLCRRTAKETQE